MNKLWEVGDGGAARSWNLYPDIQKHEKFPEEEKASNLG